jgi:ATP-binding cassette subfamily F protein 3
MLRINQLVYRIAGRTLFDDTSVHLPAGHRIGLVGRNGSGKSTLLHLVEGGLQADGGSLERRAGSRLASLAQEAPSGPSSLIDTVLAADLERNALLDEAESALAPGRIAEIHTRLADIGAHTAAARAAAILAGLGFTQAELARPLDDFSGGWRMRVALAATLFLEPDLLLLDEPTNHLDLEAVLWLENHLAGYPHTVIVVSHERDLLNRAVDHILHLEKQKLTLYRGGYDAFERTRRLRLEGQTKARQRELRQRRHIQAFVDRFRYKATKARQAQSRMKMLERMEPIAAVMEERTVPLSFPEPKEAAPPLVSLSGVSVGYAPGQPVLSGLDLRLDPDDRIALLGANGNGKSTFAKLLAGRLQAEAGKLTRHRQLAVGYFAQHQLEELSAAATPLAHLGRLMPKAPDELLRTRLGGFGFGVDKAQVAVAQLSGGEKARLLLALASHAAPQLLVLDEPSNHLDVDSREALVQALNEYQGAVLLISHDAHLVELCADRLWLVAEGSVKPYEGSLGDYRELALAQRKGPAKKAENGTPKAGHDRRRQRQDKARARAALTPLRQAARQAEAEVERLTAEVAAFDAALAEGAEYDPRHGALARQLARAEAHWLEATEALETAAKA